MLTFWRMLIACCTLVALAPLGSAAASTLYWTSYHYDPLDPQEIHGELFGLHRAETLDAAGTSEELIHQLGYQPEYNALAASQGGVFALEFFNHTQHSYDVDAPAALTPQVGAELIGAAIDAAGTYTYVASAELGVIRRGDFEFENQADFIHTGATFRPSLVVALDEPHAKIYWAGARSDGQLSIGRANLDGSEVEELPIDIYIDDYPVDLAIDSEAGKLYWTNSPQGTIQRANLDGAGVEDVVSGGLVFSIAIDVAPVPEPPALAIALIAAMFLAARRRLRS